MITLDNTTEMQITTMGCCVLDAGWIHPEATCATYELIFVTKGVVHIFCQTGYSLQEGDLLILPAGIVHYGTQKSDCHVEFFWLHMLIRNYEYLKLKPFYRVRNPQQYAMLFKEINHILIADPNNKLYAENRILNLLLELKYDYGVRDNKLVHDIIEWVRLHIETAPKVSDIAAQFMYSPDHLSRLFYNALNITLKQYVNRERVAAIKSLLATTSKPNKIIADELGFVDENNMIKFFKYHEKMTPQQYRNTFYLSHYNKL